MMQHELMFRYAPGQAVAYGQPPTPGYCVLERRYVEPHGLPAYREYRLRTPAQTSSIWADEATITAPKTGGEALARMDETPPLPSQAQSLAILTSACDAIRNALAILATLSDEET